MQLSIWITALLFFSFLQLLHSRFLDKANQLETYGNCKKKIPGFGKHMKKRKQYGFINTPTKYIELSRKGNSTNATNFSKNKITDIKPLVEKRKVNRVVLLKNSQKETQELTNDLLNDKKQNNTVLKKWKNKLSVNKLSLVKYVFMGSAVFCLISLLYNFLLNKQVELIMSNIFKEKLLYIISPPKKKNISQLAFFSYSEFRSSPFFLSTIVIASYSFYIFLKVYFERYKEAKRIKAAIQEYNKKKQEYINTGIDKDAENENNIAEKIENYSSNTTPVTNTLDAYGSLYDGDQIDEEKNTF